MSSDRLVFRHFPGLTWYAAFLMLCFLGTIVWLVRDPRSQSVAGLVFFGVSIFATATMAALVRASWLAHWKFTVDSEQLRAADWISRDEIHVPWQRIVEVRRVPRSWWNGRWGTALNEIVADTGQRVFFGTHLIGYTDFLDVLRSRATRCRLFDPHPTGIVG